MTRSIFERAVLASAILVASLAVACTPGGETGNRDEHAHSVILFVGDGMGSSQLTLGRLAARDSGLPYNLDRFRDVGLVATDSADAIVTDSAAAATAMASGVKTDNLVVGQLPDGTPVETVMEIAGREGLATGLLVTSRVTHATPAAFVTHVAHRDSEEEIARQMVAALVPDLLVGGGRKFFGPELIESLEAQGANFIEDVESFGEASGERIVALFADGHLPFRVDGGPSLADLVDRAIDILEPRGRFLLVVEGARVDHACHYHDAASAAAEQLDFDAAVGRALDRAEEWGNLLVVVTADHATGNLGISEDSDVGALASVGASAEAIGARISAAAEGERRKVARSAVYDAYGFALEEDELDVILSRKDVDWYRMASGHFASRRLGYEFYSIAEPRGTDGAGIGHDGAMVPLFAAGPRAESFRGVIDNTEIAGKIAGALEIPAPRKDRRSGGTRN